MEKPIEINSIFGLLKVIERTNEKKHNCYIYKCLCTHCNSEIFVRSDLLRSGEVESCGYIHDMLFQQNVKIAYQKNFKDGTSIPKLKNTKLQKNNTSGVQGVSWHKKTGKWQARISFKGKSHNLGYYADLEEAKKEREKAKKELHINYLKDTTNQ